MKRFQYQYIAGGKILTPFNLTHEKIRLHNDLLTSLTNLFPDKSIFYLQKNPGIFGVSLLPDAPYGPEPDALINFLFPDFHKALVDVRTFFGLNTIEIISPDKRFTTGTITWSKNFTRRHETGIILSLFEFYKLYTAAITEQKVDSVLISVFIDPNTVFCLQVPEGIPLQDILLFLQTKYGIKQVPERKPFHPILKRELDPEKETTGNNTSLIMFTHSGYTVAPDGNFLLRFPYFRRKIRIKKGEIVKKKSLPCNNCLACSMYCPSGLFPSFLYHTIIRGNKDDTLDMNINGCIQCGKCNFVCPANLPLCETIIQTIAEYKEA